MRKKIVAGNWKMNKSWPEALELTKALAENAPAFPAGVNVIIAPPAIYLHGLQALSERNFNKHFITVSNQIQQALFHLSAEQVQQVVIAYEPVWAIGTGVTASNEQAEEMHAFIRAFVAQHYNQPVADSISILYGGSVNAGNAAELFACPNVDGGLVGGASLKAGDFTTIIQAAQ